MLHRIFPILFLLILCTSLFAQEEGRREVRADQVVLEKSGMKYLHTGTIEIPFDEMRPFATFAIKIFNVETAPVDLNIDVAWSEDGESFSRYKSVGFEEHGPQRAEFRVTELMFFGEPANVLRYRITSNAAWEIPLEFHFYLPPEDYNLEEKGLPLVTERTGCTLPDYVTRTGWNCPDGQDFSDGIPTFTDVSHLVVHHSAGTNSSNNWPAVVLSIWTYHRFTNGWSDIGYNFLIDPNGVIYEGRGGNNGFTQDVLPAATCGSNSHTMAVCILGNFENAEPADQAVMSLMDLLAWKCEDKSIDPTGSSLLNNYGALDHIFGHRQGCATACPGDNLYSLLPDIRIGVQEDIIMMCDPAPANVIYVSHTLDDNNDGESNGDNDGVVESGETIEIFLTLQNTGGEDAFNVQATIDTDADCVSFIDAHIPFGDMAPGEERTDGDYDIVFSPTCNNGTIAFPLTITSDDSTWYDTIFIEVFNNCRPVAIIEANPSSGPAPLTVTYSSLSVIADLLEWTFPGGVPAAVSGAETVDVVYNQPGDYTATLAAYNECGSHDTSLLVIVDVINAIPEDEIKFVLYPNPVADILYLELQRFIAKAELQVVNTAGQEVMNQEISGTFVELNVAGLAPGLYIIKVTNRETNAVWTGKIEKD